MTDDTSYGNVPYKALVEFLLSMGFVQKDPVRTDRTWDGYTYTYTPTNSWDSIDIDGRELNSLSSIVDKIYYTGCGHGYAEATLDE